MGVDVVHHLGVGEVAVEGEITWDLAFHNPVDQVATQVGMRLERFERDLTLTKAMKGERVALARNLDVVDDQVVVGDQVALVGVIPEVAHVLDQFALVVDQGVVNREDAVLSVAGGRVLLEPGQVALIQRLGIPGRFG